MARVRMAQHDDLNPADRLQLRPSHDRGNEGIGQREETRCGMGLSNRLGPGEDALRLRARFPDIPLRVHANALRPSTSRPLRGRYAQGERKHSEVQENSLRTENSG